MITKIVSALKAGSNAAIKVVAFGTREKPQAPYVVVKQESELLGRGTAYRIIAHFMPGQQEDLDDYIRKTVSDILYGYKAAGRHSAYNMLIMSDEITPEITVSNDDGTISMERVFYMPDKFF